MASGSHEENAILISDDEDEANWYQECIPNILSTIVVRPSADLGRTDTPKVELFATKGEGRVGLTRHQLSVESLMPRIQHNFPRSSVKFESDSRDRGPTRSAARAQSDVHCPYYYDAKLELKMYRGPGFELFHPVLGSMSGHKEFCDEWDARQIKLKNADGQTCIAFPPYNSTTDDEFMSSNVEADGTIDEPVIGGGEFLHFDRQQEQHCLEQVLVVFPQVQHDFVRRLYKERHPGHGGSLVESQAADVHVPRAIIAEIAEMEVFPKQKELKRKHSPTARDNQDVTIQWDKEILKNQTYNKEALILLADEFTRIPTHFIKKALHERRTLYKTFQFLVELETTYNNIPRKPYSRSKLGRVSLEKKYQRTALEQREGHQYISIVNEFQAAREQQYREETRRKRQRADEEAEASNFTLHQLQGSLVDCQCCFNETPINRVVNCENDETHFFCRRCIDMRAKEQIGAMKHDMTCMDTSGCGAELSKEALGRALPVKISDKLAEIQQLAEIKAAGLDGLEQCPFCEFQAICASVVVDSVFECLNPVCEKVSCRKCREEAHVPMSCEEAKKDRGSLSARHVVEEARSEAMIRSCPRCKVKIVKSSGCNKMTCSNCRAVMCYICKKDITGKNYEHFGSGVTACPIQDTSPDDRHQREADDAENAAIVAAKAKDSDVNEEDLRIEAHLNQKPGRETETGRHGQMHRPPPPPPTYHLPAIPHFPLLGGEHHHMFFHGEIAGPGMDQDAAQMDIIHNALHEAHLRHNRVRGMLEDHHQRLHRLHGLVPVLAGLPAQNPPLISNPPLPGHGPIPEIHRYVQNAHPRPNVNGVPMQPPQNTFNARADEALGARTQQEYLHRRLLEFAQRDLGHDNPDAMPRYGDAFSAGHPPPLFR